MSDGPTAEPLVTRSAVTRPPRALSSFVGREEELSRLSKLMAAHRLVTLTGPGGVGKTRLAGEVLKRTSTSVEDRVWWIDLAAVRDGQLVTSAVAGVLRAQQRADRSLLQAIADVLTDDHALLLLDNCEHVIDAVATFCNQLLAQSDEIRILATSREPLTVPGEARLRLRPLAVHGSDAAGAAGSDGITLFVDRVRLVDPAFEPTGESAAELTQIVTRLDGLPLAIELAAARYESLGLAQLLQRLDQPLSVLNNGGRTVPVRHRSLRRTADWSYQLLTAQQQRVFRRISIFSAPFTLDVARAVTQERTESTLLQLVDCSLLAPPERAGRGGARYAMLESLRAFASERLTEAGEQPESVARMCTYYSAAAASAAGNFRAAGAEAAGAAWFDAEDSLVHQALYWALEQRAADALRLATSLAGWWQLRGRSVTGYRLLHQALDQHPVHDQEWLAAQTWLGRLAQSAGRWSPALTHFDAVYNTLISGPATTGLVDALAGRSGTLRNLSRLDEATQAADHALALATQLSYPEGAAFALTQLSLAAGYAGDTVTAMRWAVQAAQAGRSGIPDRLARRLAVVMTIAHIDADELDAARHTCSEGLQSARAAGDVPGMINFLRFTTYLALQAHDYAEAGRQISESLRLTRVSGDRLRLLDCLDDCAHLCAATDRSAEAITLWAARSAMATGLDMPELAADESRRLNPLRGAVRDLGPERTRQAKLRGTTMTLDTASQFASMLAGADTGSNRGPDEARLTPRERELVTLVAKGRTDAQIAEELFISIRTVRSHLDRIRDKTGSRRRADLTRLALAAGLI